jgi:diamine N-acetyltransferase
MLRGQRVTLRPVEWADQAQIVAWRNEPHVMRGLFSYRPLSLAQQEQWFAAYLNSQGERLFIVEAEGGIPIGTVGITNIDFRNRRAEYGRMLIGDRSYLRRGYATEATLLLLDYAFEELNLHRIYLKVLADNDAAVRLYRRCSFEVEGRCRDAYFAEGRFHDVLIMAVLDQAHLAARRSAAGHRGEGWDEPPSRI